MIGKLKDATRIGDLVTVTALLRQGVDPNGAGRTAKQTPLGCAAARGDLAVIKVLIEHGADPNLPDRWDATPLSYAQSPEVAELLLGLGADWQPVIPMQWLRERTDATEEQNRVLADPRYVDLWNDFARWLAPGDELWTFSSPPQSWADMMGRAGLAIVRSGIPIRAYVQVKN